MSALRECGPGSQLIFGTDKIYKTRIFDSEQIFVLKSLKGITVEGNNSKFIVDNQKSFGWIENCKECKFQNMIFDYKRKPAFLAECLSVNEADGSALMKADRDIGLSSGQKFNFNYTNGSVWGVINRKNTRAHMYFTEYRMVDRNQKTFLIYFKNDSYTQKWLKDGTLKNNGMICPMPGLGHRSGSTERAFTVVKSVDCKMSHIKINSACRFGMYIGENEGTLVMNDVDFVPADNQLDKNMNFTSWRDAFQVKDNRCRIIWTGCEASGNHDDVFNISSSVLYVSSYNADERKISLVWPEVSDGIYRKIIPGDQLSVIDIASGKDCGKVTVTEVIRQADAENVIKVDKPLLNFDAAGKNKLAYFTNRCAPDSIITDCNFSGTFRFRGPVTIENSKFVNFRTWINVEGRTEGPVPENIVFKNCEILKAYSGSTVILGGISGFGDNGNRQFHTNVSFKDCTVDERSFVISKSDANYIKLSGCKRPDGTVIPER